MMPSAEVSQFPNERESLRLEVSRLEAENARLRASEARFRAVFEQSPLSMHLFAPGGGSLGVNRAFETLWNTTRERIGDYNILRDPQFSAIGIAERVQAAFGGETVSLPPVFYDPADSGNAGAARWVEGYIYPVLDEAGRVCEVVAAHRDVTQQWRAEQLARGQVEALSRTLGLLAGDPNLDNFLGQVLESIAAQLGVSKVALWTYDAGRDALLFDRVYDGGLNPIGRAPVFSGRELGHPSAIEPTPARDVPVWAELLRTQKPLLIDNASRDERLAFYRSELCALGIDTVLHLPLLLKDELIGYCAIGTARRDYSPEELEIASALAHQATLAVYLTRLSERARRIAGEVAVAQERNRIAQEIHDTLAQALTGIIMQSGAAQRFHQTRADSDADESNADDIIDACLRRVQELAREGLEEARRSVLALRSDTELSSYHDLPGKLARAVVQLTTDTPLQSRFSVQGQPHLARLSFEVEDNLLKIGREAVTNALRHANAGKLSVTLVGEPGGVALRVHDDGQGFDVERASGFGLRGMRERAEKLGGTLSIESAPQIGTEIAVFVPRRVATGTS